LQQTAEQYNQWRSDTQCGVTRDAGNQHGTGSHQRQRDDQTLATAMTVNVGAEEYGSQRSHQKSGTKGGQRKHQRSEGTVGGEEGFGDGRGVKAVDHEVEHFEKVAADNAKNRFAFARGGGHVQVLTIGFV
jgi:hypothetical protein